MRRMADENSIFVCAEEMKNHAIFINHVIQN